MQQFKGQARRPQIQILWGGQQSEWLPVRWETRAGESSTAGGSSPHLTGTSYGGLYSYGEAMRHAARSLLKSRGNERHLFAQRLHQKKDGF